MSSVINLGPIGSPASALALVTDLTINCHIDRVLRSVSVVANLEVPVVMTYRFKVGRIQTLIDLSFESNIDR
jgi:uncharacterized membrane protein